MVKDHDYSKAADVYSFGIIMWEMMTWRLPWEELNPFQIMLRLSQQERPEVPELDTLPGQPLPGITAYIQLMQVPTTALLCVNPTHPASPALPKTRLEAAAAQLAAFC